MSELGDGEVVRLPAGFSATLILRSMHAWWCPDCGESRFEFERDDLPTGPCGDAEWHWWLHDMSCGWCPPEDAELVQTAQALVRAMPRSQRFPLG